jgi:hypothetical protein
MSDDDILNIMYDHASGFSSCIQFADDAAVIAFARDLLNHSQQQEPLAPPEEPRARYEDDLLKVLELADRFEKQQLAPNQESPRFTS